MALSPQDVNAQEVAAFIERIVRIESPTSHRCGVNAVLDVIASAFADTGAQIDRLTTGADYGDILKVRLHPHRTGRGVLVLTHVDTVHPLGTLGGALPVRRKGDRLYGPGVYDMKGGVALAVAAAQRILAAQRQTKLPVTLLFTPDEETGSPVSRAMIEHEARDSLYALVTEPARNNGKIVTARKGVGRFRITTRGKPAHAGSSHQKGASAIREMARIILEVERFTDYDRGITTNVGLVQGGSGVNVIPEHCIVEADLRVRDMAAADEMVARFHALAKPDGEVIVDVSGGLNRPPFARNGEIDALFARAADIAREIGFELVSAALVGGGSDGNFTVAQGVATLDGLGVDGDGAHTNHEYMLLSSIAPRMLLLQGLMEQLN